VKRETVGLLRINTSALLNGLRFLDSFFPSGGFAYSSGLEAAVQGGMVKNAEDLSRYVTDLFRNGIGRREAVVAGLGHDALTQGKVAPALEADRELEAMKLGQESRLASRQMGRQVMRIAAEQFPASKVLHDFGAAIGSDTTPGHFPIVMGLTLGAAGWDRESAVAGYLYQTAVGFVSAALKLLPIGQREGQRLLDSWTPVIAEISRAASPKRPLSSWTPIQDIYAMRHSRLESRLFRS
jgi:urease accessory protein